jgi:hypothetical protein
MAWDFRPATNPSCTGQIALGESPAKPADVGPYPDRRETPMPSSAFPRLKLRVDTNERSFLCIYD